MGPVRKTALLALVAAALPAPAFARTAIRANQVGYPAGANKEILVMSTRSLGRARFHVSGPQAYAGRLPRRHARWSSRWRFVYRIDLARLRSPGGYTVRVGGASTRFAIAPAASLYAPLASNAVGFLGGQRDVFHPNDARASVYAVPRYRNGNLAGPLTPSGLQVDASGGWFDAGDYLKFTGTASFTDVALLFSARELPNVAPGVLAQARWGTDWLLKMWDPSRKVLYEQVGIGDGNSRVDGDHDVWRLPQRDERFHAASRRYLVHRPVFAANRPGKPVPPNVGGRTTAAFALCAQVFARSDPAYAQRCMDAARTLWAATASTWRGPLPGSVPRAYYAQPDWRADMELGAAELSRAALVYDSLGQPGMGDASYDYMEQASRWADRYMRSRLAGRDSLNLFDPAAIAHYDLYRRMVVSGDTNDLYTNAASLLKDLRDQLALGARLSRRNPFGLGNPAGQTDTVPHALGYAAEARLYAALTGSHEFDGFAQREMNWVLGANAWGASFVVGAGRRQPHCLQHQIANLTGRVPLGATVDGPNDAASVRDLGVPDGFRRCPRRGNPYRQFDRSGIRYLDDVRSSATSEPADDYVALGLLAFGWGMASPTLSR